MRKLFLLTGVMLAACSTGKPALNIRSVQTQKSDLSGDAARKANDQGGYYALGKWHLAAGNTALALEDFRKELRQNPNSINARNGLGIAYDRLGRFDLSQRYYEEALAIEPANKMILSNLGYSLIMQGKQHEAEQVMAAAAKPESTAPADPVPDSDKTLAETIPQTPLLATKVDFNDKIQVQPDQWLERTSPHTVQLVTMKTSDTPHPWLTDVARDRKLPPVYILNAARRQGIAARFSAEVHHKGWVAGGIGNSKTRSRKSNLFYDPAMRQEALKLAWSLSFLPAMHAKPGVKGLVLYIGRDAIGVDIKAHMKDASV